MLVKHEKRKVGSFFFNKVTQSEEICLNILSTTNQIEIIIIHE